MTKPQNSDKLIIEIHAEVRGEWISASVEDFQGNLLGSSTAPLVEGATFDMRAAVIRAAVEDALADD